MTWGSSEKCDVEGDNVGVVRVKLRLQGSAVRYLE